MNAPLYLTPSELVLLHGEQFAPKAGVFSKYRLMHIDYEVNVIQLAQMVLAAAFLSCEQFGALRLEIRDKKAMLGLTTVHALYADPTAQTVQWPPHTIESALQPFALELWNRKGSHEVNNIVYAWIGSDQGAPFNEVVDRIKAGLAARGMLEVVEEKKLKIFTTRHYVLPEATRAFAAAQSIQPVQHSMQYCEHARPEIWKMLLDQVKKAISARLEKADNSSD